MQEAERIIGLDALRVLVTFLGIVLHAGVAYMVHPPAYWITADSVRNISFDLLAFILHSFRNEVYFIIAGFCANLLFHKGLRYFIQSRIRYIVIPFVIFCPVMGMIIPMAAGYAPFSFIELQPYHLWSLYYLFIYYIVVVLGVKLSKKLNIDTTKINNYFVNIVQSKYRIWVLALFVLPPLAFMRTPIVDIAIGPPFAPIIIYYAFFFCFGWLLYLNQALFTVFSQHRIKFLVLAIILSIMLANSLAGENVFANGVHNPSLLFRYFCAVMTWLFIFSIFGIMQEKFQQPSKRMRYLADATYWIYIAHLPLIVLQQHILNQVSLPIPIKFVLIVIATTTVLLISYHYLVRPMSQRNWYLDEIRINWNKRSRVIREEL